MFGTVASWFAIRQGLFLLAAVIGKRRGNSVNGHANWSVFGLTRGFPGFGRLRMSRVPRRPAMTSTCNTWNRH